MVERIKKQAALLSLLMVFGVPFAIVPGVAGMFLKIGDIKGEAVDSNHVDWIELSSMQFEVSRSIAPIGSGSREAGSPTISEVTVTKELDKSSPLLFFEALAGQSYGSVTLDLTEPGLKTDRTYLRFELENVLVSSYSTNGDASGDRPSETFALNFTKIAFSYTEFDVEGNVKGTTTKGWDLEAGKEY